MAPRRVHRRHGRATSRSSSRRPPGRAERRGATGCGRRALERAAELSARPRDERGRRLMRAADLAFELGRRDSLQSSLAAGGAPRARRARTGPRDLDPGGDRSTDPRDRGDPALVGRRRPRPGARRPEPRDRSHLAGRPAVLLVGARRRGPRQPCSRPPRDSARSRATCGCSRSSPTSAPLERGREVARRDPRSVAGPDADPEAARLLGTAAAVVGAFALAAPALADLGGRAAGAGTPRTPRQGARPGGLGRQPSRRLDPRGPRRRGGSRLRGGGGGAALGGGGEGRAGPDRRLARRRRRRSTGYTAEVERIGLPLRVNFLLAAAQVARGMSALGSGRHGEAFEHLRRLFDPADPAHHPLISTLGDRGSRGSRRACRSRRRRLGPIVASLEPLEDLVGLAPVPRTGCASRAPSSPTRTTRRRCSRSRLDADLSAWPFDRARVLLGLRGVAPPPPPRGRVPRSAPSGPRRVRRPRRRPAGGSGRDRSSGPPVRRAGRVRRRSATASPRRSCRSRRWRRKGSRTARSATACTCRTGRSGATSIGSSRSSGSPREVRSSRDAHHARQPPA